MQIRIGSHTLARAEERGTSKAEIEDVLATGFSIPAKYGKIGKAKVYEFGRLRGGKNYQQKRVEVFYAHEGEEVNTITVYVFYGRWE
jgi:hypothetical protein